MKSIFDVSWRLFRMNKMYLYIVAGLSFLALAPMSAQRMSLNGVSPKELSCTEDKLVVLKFWMNGCPSCVTMAPTFDRVATEFDAQAIFIDANIHEHREYIKNENIQTVPTVLFYKNGQLVGRTGSAGYSALRNLVIRYGGF
ncbi:MAG: Thioredoxin [candidate division TM6 bacterium GW2011_GWE2_42_60]|nr:MAG: Thioredoxin [candidate division TM6 bacterium GW2011_GWE2_42_60]HBY05336.1 hypothetical protein [Candidatus Dependentiae bacterium]